MTDSTTRSIEREIFIAAEPERVWDAFTNAEEIVNWFAIRSESQPGVGGYIGLSWDLKDAEPGRCEISEWQPNEHLRMSWRLVRDGKHDLPVEVWLKGQDGGTLLRLVHSGFLSDASWDEEYESHGRGWSYELRSLKYYLERQLGRTRRFLLEKFPVSGDWDQAFGKVVGRGGVFAVALEPLREGAELVLELPGGLSTAGELVFATEGRDFVATAAALQGGMFRIALEVISGVPEIWVWAFSWQMSEEEIRMLAQPIFAAVSARLASEQARA